MHVICSTLLLSSFGGGGAGSVAVIKDSLDNQECPYNFSQLVNIGGSIFNGCHNVILGEYFYQHKH